MVKTMQRSTRLFAAESLCKIFSLPTGKSQIIRRACKRSNDRTQRPEGALELRRSPFFSFTFNCPAKAV